MSAALKKEKEPTLLGVYLSGLLMALLGILAGFFFLAWFPARSFSTVADRNEFVESSSARAPMPGDAYYFEGRVERSNSWLQKRTRLLGQGAETVELTEGELNAWVNSRFQPGSADDTEGASLLMVPKIPNFSIVGDVLYVSLPVEAVLYGMEMDFIASFAGRFGAGPAPEFELGEARINSAAVPVEAGLAKKVIGTFLKAYTGSQEYKDLREAWSRVNSAELSNGTLRLDLN